MKIGILTYHRSHNYGALLQAIATRYILKNEGHDVYYVDYWPEYHRLRYTFFSFKKLYSKGLVHGVGYMKRFLGSCRTRWRKVCKSEAFIQQYISPYTKQASDTFDIIVYGSDQIWRKQDELGDYNPIYFGKNNFNAPKHIAFSASMGGIPDSAADKDRIKNWIKTLNAISVRESDLQSMLQQMGLTEVYNTLDPTLLMSASEWDEVLHLVGNEGLEKYALYYKLLSNSFEMKQVKDFAKHYGLKLKILTGTGLYDENENFVKVTDPYDFVSLIRNASFVFTSSFHGLAFSIIYSRPFYASFSKYPGRAESFLHTLGMKKCLLPPLGHIPSEFPLINYDLVYEKLARKQDDTLIFIRENICC